MTTEYVRFDPPRKCAEYVGQPGPSFGLALPPEGYEAFAKAKVAGGPVQFVVRGEWRRSDGVRYLDLAVDRAWIEAHTNYRGDERGHLRWTCPECNRIGGHAKGCGYE